MKRRAIIAALGATAAARPMVTHAQPANAPRRSSLRLGVAYHISDVGTAVTALFERLRELGFVQGSNLVVDSQMSVIADLDSIYAEMVKDGADILLALGPEQALKSARRAAGDRIPVVFIAMDYDPFRSGHVASLARPGANLTGLYVRQPELGVKRLEIARDILPNTRLALWWDTNVARDQFDALSRAAASHGIDLQSIELGGVSYDYAGAIRRTTELGAKAIILASSAHFFSSRGRIAQTTLEHRLPLIAFAREFVETGALLSYGVNVEEVWRQAAGYIVRIARGAKPAELPVEQPTRFQLSINLRTGTTLDLKLRAALLARADEVIE